MDISSALQILSVIIGVYGGILGIFSGFYLLFLQKVQARVDDYGHLMGRPLDYFSKKSVDRSFWIFFVYTSVVMSSSLLFMSFLTEVYFNPVLSSVIVSGHIVATIVGLVILAFLISKMTQLLPVEVP